MHEISVGHNSPLLASQPLLAGGSSSSRRRQISGDMSSTSPAALAGKPALSEGSYAHVLRRLSAPIADARCSLEDALDSLPGW